MENNGNNCWRNNKGLTLIELVICILMLSLISGMIIMFVSSSVNSYNIVYDEVNMQTEADVAMTFINELAVEAKDYNVTGVFSNDAGVTCKVLGIEAPDNKVASADAYYFVWHQADDNKMRFAKFGKSDARLKPLDGHSTVGSIQDIDIDKTLQNAGVYGNNANYLCEYVTDFNAVAPVDKSSFPVLQVQLKLEFAGATFEAAKNIASRNLS